MNTTSTEPLGICGIELLDAITALPLRTARSTSGFRSTAILSAHSMALMNSQVPAPRSTTVSVSSTYCWKNSSQKIFHMPSLNASSSGVNRSW